MVSPFRLAGLAGELREDLAVLGKTTHGVLREDELTVDEDVELAMSAGCGLGLGAGLGSDLGRETRGPCVVPASGRAVEDLDVHARRL